MKIVIADTSPLNYLILVGADEILPRLYGRVTIPDVVLRVSHFRDCPYGLRERARITAQSRELRGNGAKAGLKPRAG